MTQKKEIRYSLTNKCNFDCVFCHNEGICKQYVSGADINPSNYKFLTEIAQHALGINKFVLSGGEPLICSNVIDIAKSVKNESNEVVLITNGYLLCDQIEIADIVDEIHISLGSLNEDYQSKRTRRKNTLPQVLASIKEAKERNCEIKLNVVMLKSENKTEKNLGELVEFSKELSCSLHLIELYPEETSDYMSFSQIEKMLFGLNYKRFNGGGLKVRFKKLNYPDLFITFIPCSFASSPLIDDAQDFCKKNQSIFIDNLLNIHPCFEKKDLKIKLLDEVKNNDVRGLIKKLETGCGEIGNSCPLLQGGSV